MSFSQPALGAPPSCVADLMERVVELQRVYSLCPVTAAQSSERDFLESALGSVTSTNECADIEERIASLESAVPASPIFFPGDTSYPFRCYPRVAGALVRAISGGPAASIFDTGTAPGAEDSVRFDLQGVLRQRQAGSTTDVLSRSTPLNVWLSGRYVDFDNNQSSADLKGRVTWLTAGISYLLNPNLEVGLLGRYRDGKVASEAAFANLEANVYGVGAYAAFYFWSDARVRAGVLYEQGDNDLAIARTTGQFDSDHWTFEILADKRFSVGNMWLTPELGYLHNKIDLGSFRTVCVVACNDPVPGSSLSLSRFTYGTRVGWTINSSLNGVFEPFVSVKGLWESDSAGDLNAGASNVPNSPVFEVAEHGVEFGGGIDMRLATGVVSSVKGNYFLYDNDFQGWYLSGSFSVPF